ncbi:MAG: MFS transporter, partial [Thermomicrobiales bacterium]
ITDVPAGALLGRLGLRRAMLIGTCMVAVGTLGLAFVEHFPFVIGLRIAAGVGTALWGLSRHAFITTAVPIESRGRAISVFGGINRIGIFGGPVAGGLIATAFGLRASFVASGVMATLALAMAVWLVRPGNLSVGGGRQRWRLVGQVFRTNGRDLAAAGVAQTLGQMIRAGRHFIIPIYGVEQLDLDVAQIGLIMTSAAVLDMSMFIPAGFLMDRYGRKVAAVPSFAVMAIGVALIPMASSYGGLMLAAAVIGFGNGLGSGTMMTLGADLAPPGATGEFLGLWRLIGDGGAFLGPVAVGVIAGSMGLSGSAIVLSSVGFLAAGTIASLVRETRQVVTEPVPQR